MSKLKFLFLSLCMIVALVGCPSPVVDGGGVTTSPETAFFEAVNGTRYGGNGNMSFNYIFDTADTLENSKLWYGIYRRYPTANYEDYKGDLTFVKIIDKNTAIYNSPVDVGMGSYRAGDFAVKVSSGSLELFLYDNNTIGDSIGNLTENPLTFTPEQQVANKVILDKIEGKGPFYLINSAKLEIPQHSLSVTVTPKAGTPISYYFTGAKDANTATYSSDGTNEVTLAISSDAITYNGNATYASVVEAAAAAEVAFFEAVNGNRYGGNTNMSFNYIFNDADTFENVIFWYGIYRRYPTANYEGYEGNLTFVKVIDSSTAVYNAHRSLGGLTGTITTGDNFAVKVGDNNIKFFKYENGTIGELVGEIAENPLTFTLAQQATNKEILTKIEGKGPLYLIDSTKLTIPQHSLFVHVTPKGGTVTNYYFIGAKDANTAKYSDGTNEVTLAISGEAITYNGATTYASEADAEAAVKKAVRVLM